VGRGRDVRPLAGYHLFMCQKRPWTCGWRSIAVAALMGCAASGCSGDGPTGPGPASLLELFGNQLFRADGSTVDVGALDDTAVIGIYFASTGCPACGDFTPILVDVYDQLREDGRSFEVVLVIAGVTESALFDYMADSGMSWLAVPSQSSRTSALAHLYNVHWVPTLVIIDGATNTVSLNGREEVTQSGAAAFDAWLAASVGN